MKLSLALISSTLLVSLSQAATVTFNVIAPSATDVKVSVNGQQTALTASDPNVPLFTGSADVGSATGYNYVVGGTAETFQRNLESSQQKTLNDYYNRSVTYANLPQLPWPITTDPQWTRGGAKPAIYDDNYIPSIFIVGDATSLNDIVKNVPSTLVSTSATFVGSNFTNAFTNVTFGLHGAGKKNNNAKQSWRISLNGDDVLGGRTFFKLRHMEEDPTQIRERLYADILHAMGTYGNLATMVRLFINGQFFGTFNMLDDVTEYSYIRGSFYAGTPPASYGPLFDGATGADFLYHPESMDGYASWTPNAASPEDYSALDPLCKSFNETDVTNNAALTTFEQSFDVDRFLRFMVMEYLGGAWDNYWMGQTNDGAYKDPTNNNMWYFIDQDFDGTFGINLAEPEGAAFVSVSYKDWPSRYPGAIMINRLLQNNDTQTKFQNYLTETVRVLFNNVTLTNRALAIHNFILPDLQEDRAIVQQSPGINFGWTFDQVTQNLWEAVSAPNNNGGGASFGLIEWISSKADAMAKEFNIQVVTEPAYPPNGSNTSSVAPSGSNGSSASSGSSSSSSSSSSGSTNNNSQNANTSAAIRTTPSTIAIAALLSVIAATVL